MGISREFGIAVVGCGTVGAATAALLCQQVEAYTKKTGIRMTVRALVDVRFDGARAAGLDENLFQEDLSAVLSNPDIHLIVETVGGLTIARTIIEKALYAKKHVVTANKALLAHHGTELFALARSQGVSIGFEASCAGGIPIVRALVDGLLANDIEAIYGIVNGTSNFILTAMVDEGKTYGEALAMAQAEGLAEADPTLDVNGMDAAHKVTILGSLAFGEQIPLERVPVEGIDSLDLFDVSTGHELGYVLKLVALARSTKTGLELAVQPAFLPQNHPLARVSGPFNAVSVYGKAVGHTMYYGRGAGGSPTASAVVSDVLSIALGTWPALFSTLKLWPDCTEEARLAPTGESRHRHYLRFNLHDEQGAVAAITAALAEKGISLNSFVQKESTNGGPVPVVIITHEATEHDLSQAFEAICALPAVEGEAICLRIIDEHVESI
ncbi:MAG: homoserine dehydrogenase [Spirochaetales bacterium]|nr:homoserine dehydrogenase [Spirochaetales bacterium]